jgi:hypothetical protein
MHGRPDKAYRNRPAHRIVSRGKMRTLSIAVFLGVMATGAFAQSIIIPHTVPDFDTRMDACTAEWGATPAADRGTMTYRQFTTKCLQGKTARPIKALAACRNGTTAPATASEGACAYDGGVDRWLD